MAARQGRVLPGKAACSLVGACGFLHGEWRLDAFPVGALMDDFVVNFSFFIILGSDAWVLQ
ncbi:hypothetical protein [Paracidovorax avenae]|uniref:hypothetical protein n=1 Tax=Paracidovorax avenae TaxID=80867 RepID=UPI001AD80E60|nr:hypothetical protein [Paracidovorax avenae]